MVLLVLGGPARPAQEGFVLPEVGQVATWEAEQAQPRGEWQAVAWARAGGGAYVRPTPDEVAGTLGFAFAADQPVNVQVWPVFGPHSDRRPARRFPYPLERRPGPDALDWWAGGPTRLLFFTSPETGRVTAFDAGAERILRSVRLGGYLADLLVDREANQVYVADAVGDRVVVLNPADLSIVREVRVSGAPWSLALHQNTLYVGCLKGQQVVALSPRTGRFLGQTRLPYEVAHVEVQKVENPPSARVVVRPQPVVFDLETHSEIPADRDQYGFGRRTAAESGTPNQPGWKRMRGGGPHALKIETLTDKGWTSTTLDTKAVTGGAADGPDVPDDKRATVGPDVLVVVAGRLFFSAPAAGRVGVVDLNQERLLAPLEIGGYVTDLAADPSGTVFVADATNHRVVIVDAKTLEIKGRISVPAGPVALEPFLPPTWLKGCRPLLGVACGEAQQVVALDPATQKVTWQANLPAEPLLLKVVPPPDTGWWPLIPTDQLPWQLRTRLAVCLAPRAFQPGDLAEIGPVDVSPGFARRREVSFDLSGGGKKVFTVDNLHTVGVAVKDAQGATLETRWIDTSAVTDPQQWPVAEPLTPRDEPGAITVSVDGGPSFPWRRELWMTPDEEQLLVADSEEFWRWNAPTFALAPGRHVLEVKAHSPFVQLDALRVARTLEGWADLKIIGQPPQADLLPDRYRSLFYDREPVRFKVTVGNRRSEPQRFRLDYEVRNYLGEKVGETGDPGTLVFPGKPGEEETGWIHLPLEDTGTFTLTVTLSSAHGQLVRTCRFLRVPKLEHPRLLFRREDIPAIRERMKQHNRLFQRYFAWLRRQCDAAGFLPAGILKSTFLPQLPEAQKKLANQGGWRRYELAWRMIAVQLGAMFAEDPALRQYFRSRMAGLLKDGRADGYCMFHHHGPFFPGAEAILYDLVAATPGQAEELVPVWREFFQRSLGDMNVFPWTLVGLEEPLTPQKRALLWHVGAWLFNVERYFNTHIGTRGGQRWLNERTGCHCPYAGYGYGFIYLRHFLHEPRFHERKLIRGFLTHTELISPRYDHRLMLGPVGPLGEPLKWLDSVLCGHPLEKSKYAWEGVWQQLEQPELQPAEVDHLLAYPEAAAPTSPMAFVMPLGLALGWYDPAAPAVDFQDLPPTIFFDVEGDVIMRSGWKREDTEVLFTCGVRDHVYRHQPTHLRLAKAGEFLLGTASSWGDDGNSDPGKTWGNVVVIEPSDWLRQWGENKRHPRGEEYLLLNRFSDETFRYLARDRRLTGYAPAESGFGGGLDLHGHTESLFVQEGQILAYETWPAFDYVAGDATNAWPLGLAEEAYRQVVFVKPDTVVVYDRVALGPSAERAFWLAATGPQLAVGGNRFRVRSGNAALGGQVLLPEAVTCRTFDPTQPNRYTTPPPFSVTRSWFLFDGRTRHQKVLEIWPAQAKRKVEFLIVLQAAGPGEDGTLEPDYKRLPQGNVSRLLDGQYAGAQFRVGDQLIRVRFRRQGEVGGEITFASGGQRTTHELVEQIDDHYHHWSEDPRFPRWISDPALAFLRREAGRE